MTTYVDSALFVHTPETEFLTESLNENPFAVTITSSTFDLLMQDPEGVLEGVKHLLVSGPLNVIKTVIGLAMQSDISIGLIPISNQKDLIKCFALPRKTDEIIELALRKDAHVMDIILCNRKIMLFTATVGRLPLLDSAADIDKFNFVKDALKKFKGLELLTFDFVVASQKKVHTAACGCMFVQYHEGTLASRLISQSSTSSDGMISMLVSAPRSIVEYLTFLVQAIKFSPDRKSLPNTIAYIKSPEIRIESERELDVYIDGESATQTPVVCEAIKDAIRMNIGDALRETKDASQSVKEIHNIVNLPMGKEVVRIKKKTIPFFSYASEERFRDLFTALKEDAKINNSYLVLMFLSTILATLGLYLDSPSVVIGAMLLAPLMAPIISLAMGLLREDHHLSKNSLIKIITGVIIALATSALISLIHPDDPTTSEMSGRLYPTLLDLSVAIISGIAGAYTKSHKEIIQSLAGVAIAVALVPPLAVAGIGIGRWDPVFFGEAFLLFGTNLIGIILAATLTFRVLGYSPAIHGKRNFAFVALFFVLISIPLSLSFYQIVENRIYEKNWQVERFLLNGKYLIVNKATIQDYRNKKILKMDILARESLTRNDLSTFKRKIQTNFAQDLIILVNVIYIP